jgi:predicted metalloprotease with PDZ domain
MSLNNVTAALKKCGFKLRCSPRNVFAFSARQRQIVSNYLVLIAGVLFLYGCGKPPTRDAQRPRAHLDLILTPVSDAVGRPLGIAVSYTLMLPHPGKTFPINLEFDTLAPSLVRTTDSVVHLKLRDDNGVVSYVAKEDIKQADATYQVWATTKAVTGNLRVDYEVPVAAAKPRKRGPHVDLQSAGGGISGGFISFLLLPPIEGALDLRLKWRTKPGERAISTYGFGDFSGSTDVEALRNTLFLAGPLQVYPSQPPAHGFSMYALGEPLSELVSAAKWAEKTYAIERAAFLASPSKPFRVMIRSFDGGPIESGRANGESLMLYLPPTSAPSDPKLHALVAHEMVHVFTLGLDGEPDEKGDWYTEGIADYFSIILPYSAGLYTQQEYVSEINQEAALYYTNALRSSSNEVSAHNMWSGRNAWSLSYARGAFYFADLDAKLSARHSGVSVLDLVNQMNARIASGQPAVANTWESLLIERVGSWAVADFHKMLAGRLILPSHAFGPCVIEENKTAKIFDLGFTTPIRLQEGLAIGGVVPGSSAARAGLQDGDVLEDTTDINPLTRNFDEQIHLRIRRGARVLTISYDPHAGSVPGLSWANIRTKTCEVRRNPKTE